MKRFLSAVIAILMSLCLVSCSSPSSELSPREQLCKMDEDCMSLNLYLDKLCAQDIENKKCELNGRPVYDSNITADNLTEYADMNDLLEEYDLSGDGEDDFLKRDIDGETYYFCVGENALQAVREGDDFNGVKLTKDANVLMVLDLYSGNTDTASDLNGLVEYSDYKDVYFGSIGIDSEISEWQHNCEDICIFIKYGMNNMTAGIDSVSYDGVSATDKEHLTVGHVLREYNIPVDNSFFERTLSDGKTYYVIHNTHLDSNIPEFHVSDGDGTRISCDTLIYDLGHELGTM